MKSKIKPKFNMRMLLILVSLSSGVMSFILPIYSKEIKMDALGIAGLFSVISFILLIMRPFIGIMIDKLGHKKILFLAVLLSAVAYLIYAEAEKMSILYLARIIEGIAGATMAITINAVTADRVNTQSISEGFGKVSSARSTGNILGAILAFIVLYSTSFMKGWKLLFWIFSLGAVIALLKIALSFKDSKNSLLENGNGRMKISLSSVSILIIIFIEALTSSIVTPIFMVYLQEKFTSDIGALALAFFPAMIGDILFARKLGSISDEIGRRKSMSIGVFISGIMMILIPSTNSILTLTILWTIASMAISLFDFAIKGIYTELNKSYGKGAIYGVYSLVVNGAGCIGPLIGGVIYEMMSGVLPFYINGLSEVLLAAVVIVLVKKINIKKAQL